MPFKTSQRFVELGDIDSTTGWQLLTQDKSTSTLPLHGELNLYTNAGVSYGCMAKRVSLDSMDQLGKCMITPWAF